MFFPIPTIDTHLHYLQENIHQKVHRVVRKFRGGNIFLEKQFVVEGSINGKVL